MYSLKKRIPELIMALLVVVATVFTYKMMIDYTILILFILVCYFFFTFGKRKPIKRVEAELIKDEEIEKMVEELADEIGIKKPVIMKGKMGNLNAFAVGRKGAGTIVISRYMRRVLDEDELRAVLLHEMSHLESHDTVIMTISSAIGYVIDYIGRQFKSSILGYPAYLLFSKILYQLVEFPFLYISRKREFRADRDSAKINGRKPMINALMKVAEVNNDIDSTNINKSARQICILGLNDEHKSRIKEIFSTHPRLERRIENIKKTEPN